MTWRWALRDLMRHRARTMLSLLGVAVATALLFDMVLLSGGIERSFGQLLASRGFQLRVSPKGTLPFDTDAMLNGAAALVRTLQAEPGVAQAGAVLGTSALGGVHGVLAPLVVYGITPEEQGIYEVVAGHDLEPADTSGVLLGAPAAGRLQLQVGDSFWLSGRLDPRVATAATERVVTVRGMARFVYDAKDQPSIAVALPLAQRLGGNATRDRASFLMLRATSDHGVDSLTARLRRSHPDVSVNNIADMVSQFQLRLSYFRQMSLILGSIALVITVLLVGTLLAISVNERLGEIAALRALGIGRTTIVRQVFAEGVLLTATGGAGGVALGWATARWLDAILTTFPGLPAAISFFVADDRQLLAAAVTLLATGICAGLYPAWRAASAPIAMTLRNESP